MPIGDCRMKTAEPRKLKGALTWITPRERQVWSLLCRGLVNKEIAAALEVSHHTVEKHRQSLYAKLGVRHLAMAVLLGVKHGVVEVP
jgi:DNA-binding NarL/FixJ family response regulator